MDDLRSMVRAVSWTMNGSMTPHGQLLAERADTLVWLDLPFVRVVPNRMLKTGGPGSWRARPGASAPDGK
jgi:hypothetical protein